ncbi:hypothetical protein MX572_07295 [Rhodococcus pyridinivorans]|uniref:hypothetical protein n=1 Tax=Rhodococcus pyridinivorans TaxID=103816 RepID=UPI0020C70813|nr:hypothetical protein [Rhodococcus pyridinivorans]UTM38568.1 hypothetical protein MX572_07295 [Rhodococcus pyridinivorans]
MTQRTRSNNFIRRAGTALVAILAVVGLVAAYQFFFGAPGVGHFRSDSGQAGYVAAYERAMSALPPPSAVHDVPTRFGTVRVYEWTSPRTVDSVPVVLVPGRASGVPMWGENLPGFSPSTAFSRSMPSATQACPSRRHL